jgi:hypothetical protein
MLVAHSEDGIPVEAFGAVKGNEPSLALASRILLGCSLLIFALICIRGTLAKTSPGLGGACTRDFWS